MSVSVAAVASWLFAIFASLPGPAEVEAPLEREKRLATVAAAVALETRDTSEAALVARTLWEESGRLRRDVHEGRRKGDAGKATCLGQIHAQRLVPRKEWATLSGIDLPATRRCVVAAARLYRTIAARCDRRGDSALMRDARRAAAYATGRSCRSDAWRGAMPRARGAALWLRSAPQGDPRVPCDRLHNPWRTCRVASTTHSLRRGRSAT